MYRLFADEKCMTRSNEFFERVLEGEAIEGADQTRGRFRSYLRRSSKPQEKLRG